MMLTSSRPFFEPNDDGDDRNGALSLYVEKGVCSVLVGSITHWTGRESNVGVREGGGGGGGGGCSGHVGGATFGASGAGARVLVMEHFAFSTSFIISAIKNLYLWPTQNEKEQF